MSINRDHETVYTNIKDTRRACIESILKLKGERKYYIGATKNAEQRLNDHMLKNKMKNMYVLVSNLTKSQAVKLEEQLIKRFNSESKTNKCINQSGGGEGIDGGNNCVYILFK